MNLVRKLDTTFLVCLATWCLVNLLCMSMSSPYCSFNKYLIIWLVGLFITYLTAQSTNSRRARLIAKVLWGAHLLLILYLVLFTVKVRGSKRWILFGSFSYQPSEGLKLFYILLFSDYLAQEKYWTCFIIFLLSTVPLIFQPDLGNALIVVLLTLILLIRARINRLFIAGCITLFLLCGANAILFFPHARQRYQTYFSSDKSAKTASYQNLRALACIKAGGFIGVGPGKGKVKQVLPDAYSDFIFAVIGEELGLLGCLVVCFSFLCFYLRVMYYADMVPRCVESLWITGIGSLIVIQAWIHMGSSVWIIPTKGTGLPFISHGGSSSVVLHTGLGLLFSAIRTIRKRKALY